MFSEKYKFMERKSQVNKKNLWRSSKRKIYEEVQTGNFTRKYLATVTGVA